MIWKEKKCSSWLAGSLLSGTSRITVSLPVEILAGNQDPPEPPRMPWYELSGTNPPGAPSLSRKAKLEYVGVEVLREGEEEGKMELHFSSLSIWMHTSLTYQPLALGFALDVPVSLRAFSSTSSHSLLFWFSSFLPTCSHRHSMSPASFLSLQVWPRSAYSPCSMSPRVPGSQPFSPIFPGRRFLCLRTTSPSRVFHEHWWFTSFDINLPLLTKLINGRVRIPNTDLCGSFHVCCTYSNISQRVLLGWLTAESEGLFVDWLPKQTFGYQRGNVVGRDKSRAWDWHMHTTVYKTDNQQRPTIEHRELYSIPRNNL